MFAAGMPVVLRRPYGLGCYLRSGVSNTAALTNIKVRPCSRLHLINWDVKDDDFIEVIGTFDTRDEQGDADQEKVLVDISWRF